MVKLAPFFRNKKSAAGCLLESRLLKTEYFSISGLLIRVFGASGYITTIIRSLKDIYVFLCKHLISSYYQTPLKLKFHVGSANQQVTKALSKQVGTSETLRPLTTFNIDNSLDYEKNLESNFSSENENSWNDYLAGLIDGDGSLLISKKGYASLEITMDIFDEYALNKVKQKLGGSVKKRSGANAFRYRLHHKAGMKDLILRINGRIRNSKRIVQLKKLCDLYGVSYQEAPSITRSNSWFAGFFDADGTLGYSMKNGWPQLVVSVSNKEKQDLRFFTEVFGGKIRLDSNSNTYKWEIYSTEDISLFLDYLKQNPIYSHKQKRVFLVPLFFNLRSCRAYAQSPESLLYKEWIAFETKWNDFSF